MSLYREWVLPRLINTACTVAPVRALRQLMVPMAEGHVLEVGIGSGLNLEFYDADRVKCVYGLEPSHGMRRLAQANLNRSPVDVTWLDLPGEQIPLNNQSIDTILLTFTLCSIPDWKLALKQMYRVLKPTGKLLFCEHGRSSDVKIQRIQDWLTPIWKPLTGGCHLNRPIDEYLEQSGFVIQNRKNFYLEKSPKFVGYMYLGEAIKG